MTFQLALLVSVPGVLSAWRQRYEPRGGRQGHSAEGVVGLGW